MSHKEINFNYPDLDYDSVKGKSGKINNEPDGRSTQSIRSKEHFIETTAYPNGEIARRVDLGSFNYEDGILKDEESIWKYRAEFVYTPNATINEEPQYLGNGEYTTATTYEAAAERGLALEYENDTPYPMADAENHNKTLFKYSSFCSGSEENKCYDSFSGSDFTSETNTVKTQSNRSSLPRQFDTYFAEKWWQDPWGLSSTSGKGSNDTQTNTGEIIQKPERFNKKSADKITNFNPSNDTLEIDADSFGIDSSATFAAGKNKKVVKKKLAKQDFDFLYDQKKGGLYFNKNGAEKGFGDGGIIAILKGAPDLTSGNLEFI